MENNEEEEQESTPTINSNSSTIPIIPQPEPTPQLTEPDLATALEPFGLGRDKITGRRSTTLRQLPDILSKFQNSRDTLYFTDEGLRDIVSYAARNPEHVLENDELNKLLENAKQTNALSTSHDLQPGEHSPSSSSSDHRIRTAESPSSSNGDRAGVYYASNSSSPAPSASAEEQQDQLPDLNQSDNSFDSNHERTLIAEHPETQNNSQSTPKTKPHPPERRRSVPISAGSSILNRPRPPNRRKKVSSADFHSHTSTPSRFPQQRPTPTTLRSQSSRGVEEPQDNNIDPELHPSPELVLGTPFSNRNTRSPSFSENTRNTSANHLNPNNLSSAIFNNRQLGLYDPSREDHLGTESLPDPPDSDDNPSRILRRIRPDSDSRPNSKVSTRVYESGVGLDGYPTPTGNLQSMCEDDPALARTCDDLRAKNKELVNQIADLEEIHEREILKLTDELDELKQDLTICKKSEKELATVSSTLRYQLTNSDDQMSRMNSRIALIEDNYHNIKIKWDEAVAESEKLRTQLNLKEEELRSANRSIQAHASDVKKWEADRQVRDDHIKSLRLELQELQTTREILEEQKQANLDLKATIDRLKYELEEQRVRNAGSSVAESRPVSIAGSLGPSLGAEFQKAFSTGEFPQQDDSGSDTSGGDTEDINQVIKDYGGAEVGPDGDAIFQEIRIRRFKRPKNLMRENTLQDGQHTSTSFIEEEEIVVQDAMTDTDDLRSFKTVDTQTEPIPEPPPVYRPKMEDLQVQTEPHLPSFSKEEEGEGKCEDQVEGPDNSLLKLIAGINPHVLKLAIDRIKHEMDEAQQGPSEVAAEVEESSSSSTSSGTSETELRPDTEPEPTVNPSGGGDASTGYFHRWGQSAVELLSLDGLLNSFLPTFNGLLNPRDGPGSSRSGVGAEKRDEQARRESEMRRRLRLYSSMVVLLAAGYVLGGMIFGGSSSASCPTDLSPASFPPLTTTITTTTTSSCFLQGLKKAGADHQAYSLGILPQTINGTHSKLSSPISLLNIHPVSLADLVDFNAVAAGREGFIVLLRNHFELHLDLLIRFKNFGTKMLWSTVAMYQTNPT